jgi:hypothetical protein
LAPTSSNYLVQEQNEYPTNFMRVSCLCFHQCYVEVSFALTSSMCSSCVDSVSLFHRTLHTSISYYFHRRTNPPACSQCSHRSILNKYSAVPLSHCISSLYKVFKVGQLEYLGIFICILGCILSKSYTNIDSLWYFWILFVD